jgi:hypothetical protein
MAEVVRPELHIDIPLGARFFILFKALGNIMHMLGKGPGYFALPGEGNGLILYFPVAGIHGLCAVTLDDEFLFVPSVMPFLVLVVVVEEYAALMSDCKGPGVPCLREGIDNTSGHMEELHKPVKFFPVLIHLKVDYLASHVSCLLTYNDVEILALVDTHEAGTIIVLGYPFAPVYHWGQVLYCNISCDMLCLWPVLYG